MSDGFFTGRWQSHSFQSTFNHSTFRRAFASGRGQNPFSAHTSARQAVFGLISLNAVIFGAWQYATINRDTNLLTRLSQNFTASVQNLRAGRYWTLISAAFSHQDLAHFAFNMISLDAFGRILSVTGIGASRIISLCLGSAIIGNVSFVYDKQTTFAGSYASGLGASGMVMGAAAAATCLMPFAPMQMFFIPINIPLWVLTLTYAGLDTYFLHSNSPVGHAAHLGGSVFGLVFTLRP